jgi:putative acetyltransferase
VHIRVATSSDRDSIHSVHWAAFAESERALVSKLAVDLLSEETSPQVLSLVAESNDTVVGHVAFSPVTSDCNENLQGYILGPLGVVPDYQKRHIGSKLVERGMDQLSRLGTNILFVYGDPEYYSRFGFSVDAAERFIPPYDLEYPFGWQCMTLNEYSIERSPIKIACVTSLSDPALW